MAVGTIKCSSKPKTSINYGSTDNFSTTPSANLLGFNHSDLGELHDFIKHISLSVCTLDNCLYFWVIVVFSLKLRARVISVLRASLCPRNRNILRFLYIGKELKFTGLYILSELLSLCSILCSCNIPLKSELTLCVSSNCLACGLFGLVVFGGHAKPHKHLIQHLA